MSRRFALTFVATLLAIVAGMGATSALAINDLHNTYASVLRKNSYLINNSLLSDTLVSKISSSDPSKESWLNNVVSYLQEKDSLKQLQSDTDIAYRTQVDKIKSELQSKLNSAYTYLSEHPNSSAKDMLENTTASINTTLSQTSTPLEALLAGNELLTENNEFFKIVIAYEARKQLFADAKQLQTELSTLQTQSTNANNVGIDEVNQIILTNQQILSQETNPQNDTNTSIAQLQSLKTRISSVQQAISQENEKIAAELKRQEEERIRKEAEAARYKAEHPYLTYKHILIDISDQTIYRLEGDTIIDSSPVVTGRLGSYDTPRGTYSILNKARNIVLNSPFADIAYSYPVNYWLPFTYGGHGIHDAYTRSEYGGNIYTYNGSHGCVNTPYYYVETVFNWAEVGNTVQVID
jgi:lipoprotein-anchoring transpeptidase ErfK/SrfK